MAVEQAMRPHLPVVPLIVPGNGELLPDTRRSDHTPFWEAGFPAVMLTDTANFRNPHYHRPTDTIETLNLDFMAAVSDGVTAAVTALAS
jgi:aminopeptidase YwaD